MDSEDGSSEVEGSDSGSEVRGAEGHSELGEEEEVEQHTPARPSFYLGLGPFWDGPG